TTGNGAYVFTAQAAGVQDVYGINGTTGKQVIWTQYLDVPTVQAFQQLPESRVAASFDTIGVLFNLPVDETTATAQRFSLLKGGAALPGTLTIDSVRADKKLFYLSGLKTLLTEAGAYEFRVDLPNIQSTTGVAGVQAQSVTLTVDNQGPQLLQLAKLDSGALDAQHVNFIQLRFNEEVKNFNTASLELRRNGELLPLNIAQLSNGDLKNWTAGAFGTQTYPDGNYTFSVNLGGLTDAIGNQGSGSQQLSWTVNRAQVITISLLKAGPDGGHSNTDGITAGRALNLGFQLSDSAASVTIAQVDLSGETVLTTLTGVAGGPVSVPVTLLSGGNTGIRVSATAPNGSVSSLEQKLFIDELPLSAAWQLPAGYASITHPDTVPVVFSARLLNNSNLNAALELRRNGTLVPAGDWSMEQLNDTLYEVRGLRSAGNTPGSYELHLATAGLQKYSSGKEGSNTAIASWTLLSTNQAPVAQAGSDRTVTVAGPVQLNASASSDADGNPLTYRWVAPAGITLNDSTSATPSFTVGSAQQGQQLSFLLVVSDGELYATDVVDVYVQLSTPTWYRDTDRDGYGTAKYTRVATKAPAGYVALGGDCNDANNTVYPGAPELCDALDNDCNGIIDDGLIVKTWYKDADKDGYGNIKYRFVSCAAPAGYVADSTDCNDGINTIYPGAPELCDALDNDCNGKVDDGLVVKTWYKDGD
ncbi:MopE-related protein, partial [Paraflavisolibacter sp. H34]|uniref:putative metal-binding motif-containing protein n=1 Tax=Huijunlia imazamoxiresistens TaxID=3127457 RepID=UPI00301A4232